MQILNIKIRRTNTSNEIIPEAQIKQLACSQDNGFIRFSIKTINCPLSSREKGLVTIDYVDDKGVSHNDIKADLNRYSDDIFHLLIKI